MNPPSKHSHNIPFYHPTLPEATINQIAGELKRRITDRTYVFAWVDRNDKKICVTVSAGKSAMSSDLIRGFSDMIALTADGYDEEEGGRGQQ